MAAVKKNSDSLQFVEKAFLKKAKKYL